jgi:hypothetical protein
MENHEDNQSHGIARVSHSLQLHPYTPNPHERGEKDHNTQ